MLRRCVIEQQEFYRGLAQRVRDAEKADPFTRRRLHKLAEQYDVKGGGAVRPARAVERPLPTPRTTPPTSIFSGPGEVRKVDPPAPSKRRLR
jgi:hypothetical protein